jgi:hypothetical protein
LDLSWCRPVAADHAGSGILGEEMMWEPLRSVGMPDRDLEADGVIEGAQHLVRAGVADADRLYIYGFSAGGYLVNRIVTRPHPFAAAAWELQPIFAHSPD